MTNSTDWIVVGQFGKPYGIKGFVTVHSFTEPSDNILNYSPWFVLKGGQWEPVSLLKIDVHHKAIIAQVDGYLTREKAAELTHTKLAIKQEQLPALEANEYYWFELVGMQVVNQQGTLLGTVSEVLPTGSNDVLVVSGEKRYLIPYLIDRFIYNINKETKVITVDWDESFC